MQITFLGAAREVTGSCYLINVGNKNVMIDCGMEQGPDLYENQSLKMPASGVDAILLTHAHIDHSGKLPLMYKNGYRNKIYMTRASRDLCKIMLMDSAHIQEQEALWRNKKARRSSTNPPYTPLYDSADAENTLKLIRALDYDTPFDVVEGVRARFIDAGHLLGSAYIELILTENGETRKLMFSGDIGNVNKPIIRNPSVVTEADYVVMESTYGDRVHGDDPDYVNKLSEIISDTFRRGGNVVIPTFAVGRMQEMLYFLREIKNRKLVSDFPNFEVYVDSPLAIEATGIYSKNVASLCDEETATLIQKGINPISFSGMILSVTADDSKKINADRRPKVILSASGMCEAGRIRHHLKHNLWRPESTVVFVGYQVAGTLGRTLLDGAKAVKLFGETVAVRAKVVELQGTSSHADREALLKWALNFTPKPTRVFVTHGEDAVAAAFADLLYREGGLRAVAPYPGGTYDLISDECIDRGNTTPKKQPKPQKQKNVSSAYQSVLDAVNELQIAVASSEGLSNRILRDIAADLRKTLKKF